MRDDLQDPRFEKLVALLDGELPEGEARELRRQLANDPVLRAEYEGLSATRSLLGEWEVPEQSPHFVFLDDERVEKPVRREADGILARIRSRFRGLVIATPWAVATAALLVAFLAWKDFRIDRTNGGFAFRFGATNSRPVQTAEQIRAIQPDAAPAGQQGVAPAGTLEPGRLANATQAPGVDAYVSRTDFNDLSSGMNRTMAALLNEYSRRRDQELSEILQSAFARFSDKQLTDYADLRSRIDALQQGLSVQKSVTDSRLDYLMRGGAQGSLTPAAAPSDSVSTKEGAR